MSVSLRGSSFHGPETVVYGFSPGPAAWMYDKFAAWTYTGGEPESEFTRDEMLDDISLYWLTNTASSSAQLYWDNNVNHLNLVEISIPAAVTVFPARSTASPSWTKAQLSLAHLFFKRSTRAVRKTCPPSLRVITRERDLNPTKRNKCIQIQESKLLSAKTLGRPAPSSG